MSWSMRTCPSQRGPDPIPIVGTEAAAVSRRAMTAGISVNTMANTPAFSSALRSRMSFSYAP